jgi:AcrR family transcriptional regulator
MSTKQLLVEAAIDLFNARGLARVSVRDLAAQLDISPGNVTYHFKSKDLLVEHALDSLIERMNELSAAGFATTNLDAYRDMLGKIWDVQHRYRFFYIDAADILRAYPKVKREYQAVVKRRIEQSKRYFNALIAAEILEPLDASELDLLTRRSWMVLSFWQSRLVILNEPASQEQFVEEVFGVLQPHVLTRKALRRASVRMRS